MVDDLRERLEENTLFRVFSMKVPEKYWQDFYERADSFFRERYGDIRWVGLINLIEAYEDRTREALLTEELLLLKARVAALEEQSKPVVKEAPVVNDRFGGVRTFGSFKK